MIRACEIIKTGFSAEDATKLDKIISPLFEKGEEISVDFSGITIFTTLFFNNVFAKYVVKVGPKAYENQFQLSNLSELGDTTYQHSIDNAKNYYKLSTKDKKGQEEIIKCPEE